MLSRSWKFPLKKIITWHNISVSIWEYEKMNLNLEFKEFEKKK
jgi:hypothetical protein